MLDQQAHAEMLTPTQNSYLYGLLHVVFFCAEDSKYMSCGKCFGEGIYMAEKLGVAMGYAKKSNRSHWPKARTKGQAVIVAVCEVVDK